MTVQSTAKSARKPTHRLYRVSGEGKSAKWTPIGAAWAHQDGKGYAISCDAVPLQGRIVLRAITAKAAEVQREQEELL